MWRFRGIFTNRKYSRMFGIKLVTQRDSQFLMFLYVYPCSFLSPPLPYPQTIRTMHSPSSISEIKAGLWRLFLWYSSVYVNYLLTSPTPPFPPQTCAFQEDALLYQSFQGALLCTPGQGLTLFHIYITLEPNAVLALSMC